MEFARELAVGVMMMGSVYGAEFSREMATDRPDVTESPISVECGRFQWEMSSVSYEQGRGGEREWRWMDVNAKVGVGKNQDVQIGLSPWVENRGDGGDWQRGVSDLTLRYKVNFAGNDGGKVAWGLMPFVTVPSGSEVSGKRSEQGLILPGTIELGEADDLSAMLKFSRIWGGERYECEVVHTTSWGHDWGKGWGTYLEYVGTIGRQYQEMASTGVTWKIGKNWMWDAGGVVGLNRAAPEFGWFQGLSVRW